MLYQILRWTVSHFIEANTGVIYWCFFTLRKSLATAFCTDCNQDKDAAVMPEYRELQNPAVIE